MLPGFTLALVYMAGYVRMTRAFVLESMSEDYIRTAKSKGVKSKKVLRQARLRAALTPLVTMFGLDFAALLGGAIITENVFNYYGLGKLAVSRDRDQDLPTTVGLVLLLAALRDPGEHHRRRPVRLHRPARARRLRRRALP